MKALAIILLAWLIILAAGSFFGVLGKVIWLAILITAIVGVYGYIKRKP